MPTPPDCEILSYPRPVSCETAGRPCTPGFVDTDVHALRAAPSLRGYPGAQVPAPQGVGPRRASVLPIGRRRARRRRLAETGSPTSVPLTPEQPSPQTGAGTLPAPPLPPADSSGASWPAPRRGPRGCQAGRAPARPPHTKRLCGARRGLARGQAASGKSRELREGRRTQGGAPSSARAVAPPSARANQPSQPRRLNTIPAPPPNPLPTLRLYPAQLPILGDPPPNLSPAFRFPPGPPAYPSPTHTDSPWCYF